MVFLLIGGTGKTALRLAQFLQNDNHQFLLASRRGQSAAPQGMPAIKFDWMDNSTWKEPFLFPFVGGEKISAIYLMQPIAAEPWKPMNEFIDYARQEHNINRFVLVGGTSSQAGGPGVGMVWRHFLQTGVDYCVLRPSWFMENLVEEGPLSVIKKDGKIYTACGQGKIPFISATDIAAVAYRVLTDSKSHNCDYRVLGPELLTYDDIAEKLSASLGRKIEHVNLSSEDRCQNLLDAGTPDHYARFLVNLETAASGGSETHINDDVLRVTGRAPKSFDLFAQEYRAVWL